jgi:hypothetical protein
VKVVNLCGTSETPLRKESEFRATYREYQRLNEVWNLRAAPWKLLEAALPRPVSNR